MMKKNIILIVFALLLLGGCKKDKEVHVAKVQAETPDVTTTANAATISGTYSYASTLKSVVIVYGKDASLSSPQKVTAEHTRDSYSVTINNLDPSTKYYYYCIFDTGYGATESEQESFTTFGNGGIGTIGNHEYVDFGFHSGLLWATCNVGADSPEDYGDYYAWGETETKNYYEYSTYKWCNGSFNTLTKYNTDSNYGAVDNKTVLDPEDDAATANWGGAWRMPTPEEIQELKDNCTWEWTTQNGKNGCRVTGPNGFSIFLPAAGNYRHDDILGAGEAGYYWLSSLGIDYPCVACSFDFKKSYYTTSSGDRCCGHPVRPVYPSQSISALTVTTSSVSNITQTTATCGGNVTSDGGAAVTACGVCWSTSPNPTVSNSHTTDGSETGSFTSSITGLTENTTYYVRAYATNSAGTSYGERISFTTQSVSVPTVTTLFVSNTAYTTATCGGDVISDGGLAVTARGVCWSTSQNPTVSNSHTTDGSGTGSFTSSITGLTENTTYYVRAYATNSKGTSYGEQKSFYTDPYNGHEYVDLGLPSGLLWAKCNVGSEDYYDFPEYFGHFYAWAETEQKDCYDWSTYKWCNGSETTLTKYNTDSDYGIVDNKTILDPEDDAARANWGSGWRMPTSAEFQELYDNTTCTWIKWRGMKFTSKTDDSKYVFFPAAGRYYGSQYYNPGDGGFYWSSSLNSDDPRCVYVMFFNSDAVHPQYSLGRCSGFSVRPVRDARK